VHHFKKKNLEIFSSEGPHKNGGPTRMFLTPAVALDGLVSQ